jgi:hypothetical protein
VKYLKDKVKKIMGATKRKVFNLKHSNNSNSSSEGEGKIPHNRKKMKEKFHITGKK